MDKTSPFNAPEGAPRPESDEDRLLRIQREELAKKQAVAAEFSDAQEAKSGSFRPDYARKELADAVEENALKAANRIESSTSGVHHEAVIPLRVKPGTQTEVQSELANLLNSGSKLEKLHPSQQQAAMEQAREDYEQAA